MAPSQRSIFAQVMEWRSDSEWPALCHHVTCQTFHSPRSCFIKSSKQRPTNADDMRQISAGLSKRWVGVRLSLPVLTSGPPKFWMNYCLNLPVEFLQIKTQTYKYQGQTDFPPNLNSLLLCEDKWKTCTRSIHSCSLRLPDNISVLLRGGGRV